MKVIPAVDLREGKAVRLVKGVPGTETTYYDNPLDAARHWEQQGTKILHIVDLDAALGLGTNIHVIKQIVASSKVEIQVGGGIRTVEYAKELVTAGVARVVCGTSAVKNPPFVEQLVHEIGSSRVVVALDHVKGKVAVKGWAEVTNLDAFEIAKSMEKRGAGLILFSSVEADGAFTGPDLPMTEKMVKTVHIPVLAAGGIRNLEDLKRLKSINVYGVIVGKALYENKINFQETLGM